MGKTDEFYTYDEVVELLRIDHDKLMRLVSAGELSAFREGDVMMFKRAEIDKLGGKDSEYERLGNVLSDIDLGDGSSPFGDLDDEDVFVDEPPAERPTKKKTTKKAAKKKAKKKGKSAAPETEPGVAVRIHADHPAVFDELDRGDFADLIATSMDEVYWARDDAPATEDHGFMVHIHGPWGAGKTSILNFLDDRLAEQEWVVVRFNAWQHQAAGPPWWALINSIFQQGRERLGSMGVSAKALKHRERLWRFRTGKAAYVLVAAVALWIFSLGAEASAVKSTMEIMALALGLGGMLLGGIRALLHGSSAAAAKFMELSRNPMRPIIEHFRGLVEAVDLPIAVFVDDLDRCRADYVIELLRGLQTMFCHRQVVYVVAADREWLRAAYERSYEDFDKYIGEPGRPLGYLFLDKLFEVSVQVPNMSSVGRARYLGRLVQLGQDPKAQAEAKRKAAATAERELRDLAPNAIEERIAAESDPVRAQAMRGVAARNIVRPATRKWTEHALAPFRDLLEPNPRAMKRLVNAYGFEKAISLLSGRDIEMAPLVRWTILKMRWPALATSLQKDASALDRLDELLADWDTKTIGVVERIVDGETAAGAALDADALRDIVGF